MAKSNLETGKVLFYSYEEGQARKGTYEVCIYLKHIDTYILDIVNKWYIFSHGWCLTQTQNDALVCILLALALLQDLRKLFSTFQYGLSLQCLWSGYSGAQNYKRM